MFETDLSEDGHQARWRTRLELFNKNTKLVSDADLQEFDKKHPDPGKAAGVQAAINIIEAETKRLERDLRRKLAEAASVQHDLKKRKEELAKLQAALKALGG